MLQLRLVSQVSHPSALFVQHALVLALYVPEF